MTDKILTDFAKDRQTMHDALESVKKIQETFRTIHGIAQYYRAHTPMTLFLGFFAHLSWKEGLNLGKSVMEMENICETYDTVFILLKPSYEASDDHSKVLKKNVKNLLDELEKIGDQINNWVLYKIDTKKLRDNLLLLMGRFQ